MHKYFFQLGNTPELSVSELNAVIGAEFVDQVSPQLASVQLKSDERAIELIGLLGGTVKVIKEISKIETKNIEELKEILINHLLLIAQGNKIHFAISELGRDHLEKIEGFEIKALLQDQGINSRYVEGSRHGLSASILLHKTKVKEVYLLSTDNGVFLGETIAVQDIDDWTHKDRNKPYFNRKKGMLPPKVALIMINIAIGDNPLKENQKKLLLDPFCGTGTIVMEGLLTNLDVIGSDIDIEAVEGTKKNLVWLKEFYPFTHEYKIILSDATKIPPQEDKIQYIVTEPFLGKPKPNVAKLPFVFKGLEKLYLGAFKHWTTLLADGASIVIVFPTVIVADAKGRETQYSLDNIIDKLAKFGYTTLSKPILYHRENAVVQRQIYRFKFSNTNKE
jgi:tRNA G10  N-methylase Trm11